MKKQTEIYIHIPFCVKKCAYCDFLSAPATEKVRKLYVQRLIQEISTSQWAKEGRSVPTIFIGGGTPSILEGEEIVRILETVREHFFVEKDAEITIECNPGTLCKEKLDAYKKAGINRISIGLQSANNEELKLLGRIHTYEDFLNSYQLVKNAGFDNINIDLMSALPGQSLETYAETLKKVCDLEPQHISAYSLIIEEGTPFYDLYEKDCILREKGHTPHILPSEEEERRMYEYTKEYLASRGYARYEISNYAKEGYECKHNIGYWDLTEYIGFGIGAAGFADGCRYKNSEDLKDYLKGIYLIFDDPLSEKEQMEEFMFLGLRIVDGVSKDTFFRRFGVTLDSVYGDVIEKLIKEQLLKTDDNLRYSLTKRGCDISNYVFTQFILDY